MTRHAAKIAPAAGNRNTMWTTVRFWIGILLLLDAVVALGWEQYWQRLVPAINIRRLAKIEATAGMIVLIIHFMCEHA